MKGRVEVSDGSSALRDALADVVPQEIAEPGKRGKNVWLRDDVHAALRERAESVGVSMSALIANLVEPPPYHTPSAREAKDWVKVADRLRAGDVDGARAFVHVVLMRLRGEHAHDIADDAMDWSG